MLIFITLLAMACKDRDDGPLIEMAWYQTQCADPWGTGEGNSNAKSGATLLAYLEAR